MGAVPETSFFVNERGVPWHGLGEGLDEAPEKRLAQLKAGLNWEGEKEGLYTASGHFVPDTFAVVRNTDQNVLGVVGSKYVVIQPRDLFEILEACLQEGARFETGGQLFGGRLIWALARTEGCVDAVTGDTLDPYLLITNTFDGSSNLQGCLTAVRVVCENTIGAAIKAGHRHIKIRHTAGWFNKVAEAKRILGTARDVFADMQQDLAALVARPLDFGKVPTFVDKLIELPKAQNGKRLDSALLARSTLEEAIMHPIGHDFGRGSLYQAWAGVTEFASHRWEAKRHVGTPREQAERRMADLALSRGPRNEFTEQAWSLLPELEVK